MPKILGSIKEKIVFWVVARRRAWSSFYAERGFWGKLMIWSFGAFLVADLLTVFWGMPNFASWSPDDQSGPFIIGFAKFPAYKYAAFGYIINFILYIPILGLYFLTGNWDISNPKYPDFGFPHPHWQIGALIVVSRLLSFAMYLGAGYFLYSALKRFGRRIGFLAAIMYMSAPIVVEFSTYGNLDTPIMFYSALCFWALSKIYFSVDGEGVVRARCWSIFFLFLAAISSTKEPNAFTFVIPFVFIFFRQGYLGRGGWKRIVEEMLPGIMVFGICFSLFTGLVWDWAGYVRHVQRWIGPSAVTHDYQQLGLFGVWLRTLEALALGAPLVLLSAVGGLALSFRRKGSGFMVFAMLFPLSFFVFSLWSVGLVYLRYVIVIIFFLSLPAALFLDWAWGKVGHRRRVLASFSFFAVLLLFAVLPIHGKMFDSRYDAEKFIASMVSGKDVQVLSNRYHTYLPRMEKMDDDRSWSATSIVYSSTLDAKPDKDLYIVEYEKFERYRKQLQGGYGLLYDSGPRYMYWHAIDPGIEPCRISCRVLVLERKDTGVNPGNLPGKIRGYYDTEKTKEEYEQ